MSVLGIDLSDVPADGEDALSAAVLEFACAGARLVQSPAEALGLVTALEALRAQIAEGMPLAAAFVDASLDALQVIEMDLYSEADRPLQSKDGPHGQQIGSNSASW